MSEYYLPHGNPPQETATGTPIIPGETVKITNKEAEDPHNKYLIDEMLQKIEKGGEK
jgi:hypothetical protein